MAEIASAFVSIAPSLQGFSTKLSAGVTSSTGSVGKSAGSAFGKVFAAAAALGIGAAVGGFLKDAIGQASDLNEVTTKTQAIFGRGSKAIEEFASKGAQALGQTKLEVLDASASFGTFGKAAGLSGVDLAKFSTGFVSLSTDLASFNNTTPQQAVEAIGAALRGEAEPLRQYGVLLNDATLKSQALKLGLIKTTSEALTPQQKVLAAQAAIYKQTRDAQGDFQKTSGGLANQQRILSASFSDIKTQIGTALLPVATQFFTFLNSSGVPALKTAADTISGFLGPAFDQIGAFFNGAGGQGLSSFATTVQANLLPVLQTMATTFQTVILPALTQLGGYLRDQLAPVFTQVAGIVTSQVLPILSSLAQFVYGRLYPAIIQTVAAVLQNLRPAFEAIVQYVKVAILPAISALLAKFREYQPTIEQVVLVVVKVAGKIAEFAASIISFVLPKVLALQTFFIGKLVPAIGTAIDVIASIIKFVVDMGEKFVAAVKKVAEFQKGVVQKVRDVLDYIGELPGKVVTALGEVGSLLLDAGRQIIDGLWNGLKEKWEDVKDWFGDITSKIPDLKGPAEKDKKLLTPAGQLIMQGLIEGIVSQIPALEQTLSNVTTKFASSFEKVRSILEGERDRIKGVVDGLRSAFDSLSGSIASTFAGNPFEATTYEQFITGIGGKMTELTGLKEAFRTLRGWGISSQFISQLFASGNGALILDLAAGTKQEASLAATGYAITQDMASGLGSQVAGNQFRPEITRVVNKLDRLEKAIDRVGPSLAAAINGAAAQGKRSARRG